MNRICAQPDDAVCCGASVRNWHITMVRRTAAKRQISLRAWADDQLIDAQPKVTRLEQHFSLKRS
jgi:hypothetical protein